MKIGWKVNTNEQKQALLIQARKIALMALQQFDLEWTEIKYINISDAITFKVTTKNSGYFLLRLHNDNRKKEEIYSEITFLNHLSKLNLIAPRGRKSRRDEYVLYFEGSDGEVFYVTLMDWIDGEIILNPSDVQVTNMGYLLAQIHDAGETFIAERNQLFPKYNLESFQKNIKKIQQYYSTFMTETEWKTYQKVIVKITSELAIVEKNIQHFGIIHADFHLENIVFQGEEAFPIDFGRCGYGNALYDIAANILGLSWQKRKVFIKGYEGLRFLNEEKEQLLKTMFVRVMIENYCHHCSNPNEIENLKAEQPYAQTYLKAYLENRPFLFEPLEI